MGGSEPDRAGGVVAAPEICAWNCQGLVSSRIDRLHEYLTEYRPLAMVVTETKRPASTVATHHIKIDNYRIHEVPAVHVPGGNPKGGIMFLTRSDCTGSELLRGAHWPAYNHQAPYSGGDTSSQWATLRLRVHGAKTDIILLGVYIRPGHHHIINPTLLHQITQLHQRLEAEAAADPRSEPNVLMCGDFNCHHADLGGEMGTTYTGDQHQDPGRIAAAEVRTVDGLQEAGFDCVTMQLARGIKTHTAGGVLDLFFERCPDNTPPIIRQLTVHEGPADAGSDHFVVHAGLTVALSPPPPPARRPLWNTETADELDTSAYIDTLNTICEARLTEDGKSRAGDLANRLAVALSAATSFTYHHNRRRQWKADAGRIADELHHCILSATRLAARSLIGQRTANSYAKADWTPELRLLYTNMKRTGKRRLRLPSSARRTEEANAARAAYTQAAQESKRAWWAEMCEKVEATGPTGNHRPVFTALKRIANWKSPAPPIGAGIAHPTTGQLTTTAAESAEALGIFFAAQLSEHKDAELHDPHAGQHRPSHPLRGPGADDDEIDNTHNAWARLCRATTRIYDEAAAKDARKAAGLRALHAELARPPTAGRCLGEIPADELLASTATLTKLLQTTPKDTAAGPDGITGPLLRWAAEAPHLVAALRTLINFCHAFYVQPQGWRDANMLPLLKKNSTPTECGSYRPISITDILIRRAERLMQARVADRLDAILTKWQAGFRKHRSTQQQIIFLQHRIAQALRKSKASEPRVPYPVVFLDISRAFDSAPHDFILLKLYQAGLRGADLQYFNAFLRGRRFRIITPSTMGRWMDVTAGVPQGAVLSPLLYAVFIDDCSVRPDGLCLAFSKAPGGLLYADDIVVAPSAEHGLHLRHSELQGELTRLGDWARRWRVRFSAKKSGCVWYRDRHTRAGSVNSWLTATALALPQLTIPYTHQTAIMALDALEAALPPVPPPPPPVIIHATARRYVDPRWPARLAAGAAAIMAIPSLTSRQPLPAPTAPIDSRRHHIHIPTVETYQYLGVWLSATGSSTAHFQHMRDRCQPVSNLLRGIQRPDGPPGFEVIRTLVKVCLVPRITYGLPFCMLTQSQYDKLNALMYRPLLSALHLAPSVHRASLAAYVGLPQVEILREQSLIRVVASIMRGRPDPVPHLDTMPAVQAVWQHCSRDAVQQLTADIQDARIPKWRREALADPRSPFARFCVAANRWGVVDMLPAAAQMAAGWPRAGAKALARHLDNTAHIKQRDLCLQQAHGHHVTFGTNLRRWDQVQPHRDEPRGALILPLLGVPVDAVTPDQLAAAAIAITGQHAWPPGPTPSLLIDDSRHARARARASLNRELTYRGVRVGGQLTHERTHPYCTYCGAHRGVLVDETARHVIADCPRYAERRQQLLSQLHSAIRWVRTGIAQHPTLHRAFPAHDLHYRITLCPPALFALIHARPRERLLRLTGGFLSYIRDTKLS